VATDLNERKPNLTKNQNQFFAPKTTTTWRQLTKKILLPQVYYVRLHTATLTPTTTEIILKIGNLN